MKRGWTHTASSRSVRILQALADAGDLGLTLGAVVAGLGESGRKGRAVNVTMLKSMRDDLRVSYSVPTSRNSAGPGRPSGTYKLTQAGADWLRARGFFPGEQVGDQQLVLETGAMRGETHSVTRTQAQAGQVPTGAPNWVFSLGSVEALGARQSA